jgi:hypothetical protein
MSTKIKVLFEKLYVADHGDPNFEPKGELYYRLKVDNTTLAMVTRNNPLKVADGQTIFLNKSVEVEKNANEFLCINGYVGEMDPGKGDKNDEKDTINIVYRENRIWGAGRHSVEFVDQGLKVILHYVISLVGQEIEVVRPPAGSIRPTRLASLTLVSFDDSPVVNLIQNAHNVYGECFAGYDKSILLKESYTAPRRPDVLMQDVTKDNFLHCLRDLADDGYAIDLFIFTHGRRNVIDMKNGIIRDEDIDSLASGRYKDGKFPLRMVYQMNCDGSGLNDNFIKVGAKAVCGSRTINFMPNQFNAFARNWNRGETFSRALTSSNTASSRTAIHTLLLAEARLTQFSPRCKPFQTVLGRNECAEAFFSSEYLRDRYRTNMSGKDNVNYASRMIVAGDPGLRKSDREVW